MHHSGELEVIPPHGYYTDLLWKNLNSDHTKRSLSSSLHRHGYFFNYVPLIHGKKINKLAWQHVCLSATLTCCWVKFFSVLRRYGVMKGSPGFIEHINPKKHKKMTAQFHFLGSLGSSGGPSEGDEASAAETVTCVSSCPPLFSDVRTGRSTSLPPLPAVSSTMVTVIQSVNCFAQWNYHVNWNLRERNPPAEMEKSSQIRLLGAKAAGSSQPVCLYMPENAKMIENAPFNRVMTM